MCTSTGAIHAGKPEHMQTFPMVGGRGHQRLDHTHSDYEGRVGGMRGVRVRGGRGGRGGDRQGHRQVCTCVSDMSCVD